MQNILLFKKHNKEIQNEIQKEKSLISKNSVGLFKEKIKQCHNQVIMKQKMVEEYEQKISKIVKNK